jgi:hypothetical protein
MALPTKQAPSGDALKKMEARFYGQGGYAREALPKA